jgi:hypothetical protein
VISAVSNTMSSTGAIGPTSPSPSVTRGTPNLPRARGPHAARALIHAFAWGAGGHPVGTLDGRPRRGAWH